MRQSREQDSRALRANSPKSIVTAWCRAGEFLGKDRWRIRQRAGRKDQAKTPERAVRGRVTKKAICRNLLRARARQTDIVSQA